MKPGIVEETARGVEKPPRVIKDYGEWSQTVGIGDDYR